jgi:hypothetical protein
MLVPPEIAVGVEHYHISKIALKLNNDDDADFFVYLKGKLIHLINYNRLPLFN